MKKFLIFFLMMLFSGLSNIYAKPDQIKPVQNQPDTLTIIKNIFFAKTPEKDLYLDLYLPASLKSLPIVVWIHGGAWRGGSKNRTPAYPLLTDNGYAVASITYRLSQDAIFPAQIYDCKAAIRWLRANAKQYNLNPEKIGIWGSSAGGHLVALLGTSGAVQELEGSVGVTGYSSRVQAVCDWFGPTDFLQMDSHALPESSMKHDTSDSPESQLVGGPIQENKAKVEKANPITYISKDDPPFLIMHGEQDKKVSIHQSKLLVNALQEKGVKVTFHPIPGAGHGVQSLNTPDNKKKIIEFFDKYIK